MCWMVVLKEVKKMEICTLSTSVIKRASKASLHFRPQLTRLSTTLSVPLAAHFDTPSILVALLIMTT